jgi:hypothetical protein
VHYNGVPHPTGNFQEDSRRVTGPRSHIFSILTLFLPFSETCVICGTEKALRTGFATILPVGAA